MSTTNRRSFLNVFSTITAGTALSFITQPTWSKNLVNALSQNNHRLPSEMAGDEEFWYHVQQAFTVSSSIINLNNGGVSPSPKVVQEAMKRYHDYSNEAPSYYMWQILDHGREPLRQNLAQLAGCSLDEIAIQRNASEALETVIFGLDLKKGDEVVLTKQDYPNMINAWKQREMRDGIKLVWVNLELPSEDDNYLVSQYAQAFTPKTKVVHITHCINWNGQIIPVKKIAQAAKTKGIEVLVDGAHTFAHFDFKIPDLECDYFGTSLHKWLAATIGTGFLYIKKEKIKQIYPFFASAEPKSEDIRKFESLGTRPFFIEQAITKAVEFHEMIGSQRKEERLHFLKNYWMTAVKDKPRVRLHTSLKKPYGCAIGMVSVDGKKPEELSKFLMDKYKIHTVPIEWENIEGVRITPNVYTSVKNLDVLIEGIDKFVKT